jgi:hypothetical protein
MTPADVVIGIGDEDLPALAARLGELLDVRFEERDSGYYAGPYYLAETDGDEELRLYRNRDPLDGTPYVGDAEDSPTLLRLLFTERDAEELAERIRTETKRDARLLRRNT